MRLAIFANSLKCTVEELTALFIAPRGTRGVEGSRTCRDINIRYGVPKLETAFKAAWDRQWAAFASFVTTPATTLAGLAVKTSAILYFEVETRRALRGTVADQKELEPEQQILLTLRRDLLRMAGLPDNFAMEYAEVDEQCFDTAEWHGP